MKMQALCLLALQLAFGSLASANVLVQRQADRVAFIEKAAVILPAGEYVGQNRSEMSCSVSVEKGETEFGTSYRVSVLSSRLAANPLSASFNRIKDTFGPTKYAADGRSAILEIDRDGSYEKLNFQSLEDRRLEVLITHRDAYQAFRNGLAHCILNLQK